VIRDTHIKNGILLTIGELRAQIDNLDDKIIDIFEKRMLVSEKSGSTRRNIIYQFSNHSGGIP